MGEEDIETIAHELTPGQRAAVRCIEPGVEYEFERCDGRVRVKLFTKGLFHWTRAAGRQFYGLTDLGERVRKCLLGEATDGE